MDVQGALFSDASTGNVQGASLSIACSVDVQGVSSSAISSVAMQDVSLFTSSSINGQGVAFFPLVQCFKCQNWNKLKCRCQEQSGTQKEDPVWYWNAPVPD
jgi:hypothetical protein